MHRLAAFLNVRQFGERIFSDLKETYWMIGLALIGTEFISFADTNIYPRCMSSVIHMDCSDEISCWIHGLGLNFDRFPWNRELAWLLCIQAVLCLDIIGSRDTQEYLSGALIFLLFQKISNPFSVELDTRNSGRFLEAARYVDSFHNSCRSSFPHHSLLIPLSKTGQNF